LAKRSKYGDKSGLVALLGFLLFTIALHLKDGVLNIKQTLGNQTAFFENALPFLLIISTYQYGKLAGEMENPAWVARSRCKCPF